MEGNLRKGPILKTLTKLAVEQLIVFRKCCHYLAEKGIEVVANIVGEVLTVQEMAGFQLFIARMDDELLKYWNAPCLSLIHI